MHWPRSNSRRSRLKPTTYSMCCQRPSSPPRLTTLALPDTAPTRGIREGLHQPPDRVRLEDRVTVDHHQQVERGGRDAGVERGRLARVGCRMTRTPGRRRDSTRSAVPSVEPSSTTIDLDRVVGGRAASARRPRCRRLVVRRHDDADRLGHRRAPRLPRRRTCRRAAITHGSGAQHAQHARRVQQPAEHGQHAVARASAPISARPSQWSRGARRAIGRGMPTASLTVANGEAAGGQLRQQPVERGDGLRAVAAAVVHEQDLARACRAASRWRRSCRRRAAASPGCPAWSARSGSRPRRPAGRRPVRVVERVVDRRSTAGAAATSGPPVAPARVELALAQFERALPARDGAEVRRG